MNIVLGVSEKINGDGIEVKAGHLKIRYEYFKNAEGNPKVIKCTITLFRDGVVKKVKPHWVGIAKCNDVDTYDEVVGRNIALSKAVRKYGKAVMRFREGVVKDQFYLNQYVESYNNLLGYAGSQKEKISK